MFISTVNAYQLKASYLSAPSSKVKNEKSNNNNYYNNVSFESIHPCVYVGAAGVAFLALSCFLQQVSVDDVRKSCRVFDETKISLACKSACGEVADLDKIVGFDEREQRLSKLTRKINQFCPSALKK